MGFLWAGFRKDWQRVRRDPAALGASLGIPLILAVLLSLVFGRDQPRPHGLLLVADQDGTILSNALLGAFQREPLSGMFTIEKVTAAAGRERIDRGDGSALLVIPDGFQVAFLTNVPVRLQLVTNPSQEILPQMTQETLSIMVDAGFYLQRIAAAQLRSLIVNEPPSDQTISAISVSISHVITNLQRYLNPPLIALDTAIVEEQRRSVNFAAAFLPSSIFMGLLFVASSLSLDIWRERMHGTLRRVALSPVSMSSYLAGRVVFVASIFAMVAILGLSAAHAIAGMPVPHPAGAVLWMTFTGSGFYLLLLLIQMAASTLRAASVTVNLLVFPLAMLGGCFFPFEWMPDWMAHIGRMTPNGWAITQFKAILAGSIDARQFAVAAAALFAVAVLAFLLALRRLRSGFAV